MSPADRRELVNELRAGYGVSVRRACRVLQACRSTQTYKSKRDPQAFLRRRMHQLAEARPRYGYRRIHVLLCREGWEINKKKVYRLYSEEGLQMRRKPPRRRVSAKVRGDRTPAVCHNDIWSMDFVHDQLYDGGRLRFLTIIDNWTRICPGLGVGRGYCASDVIRTLEAAVKVHGRPKRIYVDNGPEFISKELDLWAYTHKVELDFSRPGKPTDNAFIEAFNSRFRQEFLNLHWFMDLDDARARAEEWRLDYNSFRPHGALENLTPLEFSKLCAGTG